MSAVTAPKQLALFQPPVPAEPAGVAAAVRLIRRERLTVEERYLALAVCCRVALAEETRR